MFAVTWPSETGPEPAVPPRVLDILGTAGISATFFVLGSKLADPERRAIAKRAHAAGHWIGNHTWSHTQPLGRVSDPARVIAEIVDTQSAIHELAHPDQLFRPCDGGGDLGPHLLHSAAVDVLTKEKMTCVLWNAIPRDWEVPPASPETPIPPTPPHPPPPLVPPR